MRIKVLLVFGTRPEAVKMCPLVLKMRQQKEIGCVVCLTGQHKEMLEQVMDIFGIQAQYNLNIMRPQQLLTTITTDVLNGVREVLVKEKPDLVLVHGDTTTSFAAALAAFYEQIPVGHVEAGLRTYDKYSPFPEEMNRSLTGRIAQLHFAPTFGNRENLEREHASGHIYVTGNTVIDAFRTTVKKDYMFKDKTLRTIDLDKKRCVLITAHRRENLGHPLEQICDAIKTLAERYPDMLFVYPLHLNPKVQLTARQILENISNVYLLAPIDVEDMHNLISRSFLVMTDSGGLQEEAPACGVPVLVLRTETERPEAAAAGTVRVTGTEKETIIREATVLIEQSEAYEEMAKAVNPYGDGHACERIVKAITEWKRSLKG